MEGVSTTAAAPLLLFFLVTMATSAAAAAAELFTPPATCVCDPLCEAVLDRQGTNPLPSVRIKLALRLVSLVLINS